ncbi:hypothetical protein Goshw_007301 [Gossypium schwendimanii]|uniref:RNase H type-1 domain-containing protein n=1 Tax=Gossypium schwendimanii TaxID=34291 RepID=A0A7J9MXW6_GOSSC|nr:hypothetical protein [Gossypium schwendimanii]
MVLAAKQRLLTNLERTRQEIGHNSYCPRRKFGGMLYQLIGNANFSTSLFKIVASGNGSASARGVLQDQHGNWILGFNHFLKRCSIFKAKLWGILDGLLVLVSKTFKRTMIQTNNPKGCKCFTRKFVSRLWYYTA